MKTREWIVIIVCAVLALALIIEALPPGHEKKMTYGTVSARGLDGDRCFLEVTDGQYFDWWEVTADAYESCRIGDSVSYRSVTN